MSKKIFLFILFQAGLFYKFSCAQDLPISTNTSVDFGSNRYIRIFDGYLIPNTGSNPSELNINRVITLDDAKRAKTYHLPVSEKPYMILSTETTDLRNYIYKLANVSISFSGINLPIILDGQLITFEKYHILDSINKKDIIKAEWFEAKKEEAKTKTPFGVIKVKTK